MRCLAEVSSPNNDLARLAKRLQNHHTPRPATLRQTHETLTRLHRRPVKQYRNIPGDSMISNIIGRV
jgi:hypothetical protein